MLVGSEAICIKYVLNFQQVKHLPQYNFLNNMRTAVGNITRSHAKLKKKSIKKSYLYQPITVIKNLPIIIQNFLNKMHKAKYDETH